MKITLLGIELDEDEVMKKVVEKKTPTQFNSDFFTEQLDEYAEEVERFSQLGKDFKKDYIDASRIYNALIKIDEWFRLYNTSDQYPIDRAVRVKKLTHLKLNNDKSKLAGTNFTDYVNLSGLYTVMEVYIIPFDLINNRSYEIEDYLDVLRKVSMDMSKPSSSCPDRVYNTYGLPEDAKYGSARVISPTHFAVVACDQDNPYADYIERNISWRYISPAGYAV